LGGLTVFVAGSDLFSWAKTGPLTRPLLEWLYPEKNTWAITLMTFELRKLGHVFVYGFLTILIMRVIVSEFHLKMVKASLSTLAIVALIAAADETKQWLLPSRTGLVTDVGYDLLVATVSLLYYWWVWWVRKIVGAEGTYAPRCSPQI
jgi:hypothetical protein